MKIFLWTVIAAWVFIGFITTVILLHHDDHHPRPQPWRHWTNCADIPDQTMGTNYVRWQGD